MVKLLITMARQEDELAVLASSFRVAPEDIPLAASSLGDSALICRNNGDAIAVCRVAGLYARGDGPGDVQLRVSQLRLLATPVAIPEHRATRTSGVTVAPLHDATYDAVMAELAARPSRPEGFAEDQAPFSTGSAPDFDDVADAVAAAYANTCAFTGTPLLSIGGMTNGSPAAIRPLASGGTPRVTNFIAAIPSARLAFEAGHLTLGTRYEFIVVLDRIDPELLEMLNPIGRLRLPAEREARPDPQGLEYHRTSIFNRP